MTQASTIIEQHIQAARADVAPRITPEDIEANIVSEHYFTGTDGFIGAQWNAEPRKTVGIYQGPAVLRLLTICVLVLRNDTKIVGINYGAIDPAQHSDERGRQEARADAVRQIWPLMGYELRTRIAEGRTTIADRSGLAAQRTDCPHAAPHRYCYECVADPCPIGLATKGGAA